MLQQTSEYAPLPPDDLRRTLRFTRADATNERYIGLVGDTYTITVAGEDTHGRFCVIDMHVPPGGGPGPHRHDYEETLIVLEGAMEFTFRGEKLTALADDTINLPSNAPHRFHNASSEAVRMICICSPAGIDKFFLEVGVPVATRTTPPPRMDAQQMSEFQEKTKAMAPKYRTELLGEA